MFSFFTRRTREPSTRLRLLARGFQFTAVSIAGMAIAVTIALQFFKDHAHTPQWLFTPFYAYVALSAASSYLIGRALLRRQRWGAYLAGLTLGAPLIRQLLSPDANILSIRGLVFCTVALCVTVTVWDELGTARDADFDEENDDVLTKRNRGYGEGRALPAASAPNTFAEPLELKNVPVHSRKADAEI
ncbi:MAG: hypothetical protein ABI852_11495 [Gemmatimonadaceae bacterium]